MPLDDLDPSPNRTLERQSLGEPNGSGGDRPAASHPRFAAP
jgi:hypothetical protein